jgi:hypothetical protein
MATLSESVSELATKCDAVLQEEVDVDQVLQKLLNLSMKKESPAVQKEEDVPVPSENNEKAEESGEDEDTDSCAEEGKAEQNDEEEENDLNCEKTIVFSYDEKRLSITNYTLKGEKRLLINEFDFKKSDFLNILQSLENKNEDMMNKYGAVILIGIAGFCAFSLWLVIMLQSLGKM